MDKKSQMVEKLADLTPAQRALLEKRLKGKGLGQIGQMMQHRIPKRVQAGPLPLSSAQQRLWVVEQFDQGNYAYNIPVSVRMTGRVDLALLERCLNEVVSRHESLRTTFATVNDEPVQVIAPTLTLSVPLVDLRPVADTLIERAREAHRLATVECQIPFDLERGPLLRAKMFQVDEADYVLALVMHHIVSDGWSMGLVIQEICALYQAFYDGQPSPLPELPIQYGDFSIWQRNWLQSEALDKQLDYWKQQLAGSLPILQLPTDYPRPLAQTFHGAVHAFHLPKRLVSALQELSQSEGATLFMVLMALYNALLLRYTGQENLVVGTPIANRNRGEIESLIGVFVNTLVFRTDLSGNLTFRELLGRVRQVAVEAFANQDVPFEKLVDALQPERHLSHPVLVQAMFILQNTPMGALELPGLSLRSENIDNKTAKFDLTLSLIEQPDGLLGEWEYNTDLFAPETVARMSDHFLAMVEAVVVNPEQHVWQLPLLTEAERHRMLVEWNDTARPEMADGVTLQQLMEAQAERTPDRVAVDVAGQQLTFRELNARANRLAHHLRKQGVGPETKVGISMERSLELLVALVGILKAGGAYVPLDPSYPAERIAYVLDDAAPPVLLTQEHLLAKLPAFSGQVLCLDTQWAAIAEEATDNLDSGATGDNLAYVMYTSGSTGKPKGVMITHRSVCNRLLWGTAQFAVQPEDRVLQKTPFSFDISVWELFWPLITGMRLVMARPGGHQESAYLRQVIQEQQITIAHFVPSMMQLFLDEPGVEQCRSLRLVVNGGEAMSYDLQERFFAKLSAQYANLYGPTECTIECMHWICQRDDERKTVPIGSPIANTQAYVLDKWLQPVPIGVAGELHIGGAGLARGYHQRPDLTAEKFIPNPFGGEANDRLYKTGDLVRYRADGAIEYLGRMDFQVKVRGFRIELEEIEATLLEHAGIQQAVVMAREETSGSKRLVAYLVVDAEQTPTIAELRAFLLGRLPEYMVPSFFVTLKAFPLSPNGKVDRKALPAPEVSRLELQTEFVAAEGNVQEVLAAIWAQVLRLERVGVNDNFFELGGDSILAIQVVNKAKQAGLQLTPKQLFEHPSIAKLATGVGTTPVVHAEQTVVTGAVPLTPIQQAFLQEDSLEPHHFNQAVMLEVRRPLQAALLEQAIGHLLVHHDALRMRFTNTEAGWHLVNAGLEDVPFFVSVDLSHVAGEQQIQALEQAVAEWQKSLDLAKGPLLRVVHFQLGDDKSDRLLLVIHHLVVDGVSWRILLEDLHLALDQLCREQEVQLPQKTTSFQHWAGRLAAYAQSPDVEAELGYWLADARHSRYKLPVDDVTGANTEASVRTLSRELTAEETHSLLHDVPGVYNTQINDVLLTALAQTLTQWAGTAALLVDLEGHGREDLFQDVDISRTVGWFTTVFPVLLTLRKTANPGEKLKAVKEQLRAVPNRGIGYGLLRYLSGKPMGRELLQQLPQAEVVFNYLGQFDNVLPADSPFAQAGESVGAMRSPLGTRRYLLEIDSSITGGVLQVTFRYCENIHRQATVEGLLQEYLDSLRTIIQHCKNPNAGGYTPSDFSKAKMNQKDLNKLLGKLSKGGRSSR